MKTKTCCFTGHRYINQDKTSDVKEKITQEVLKAVKKGYTHFISCFSPGADMLFVEVVTELKKKGYKITLETNIPPQKNMAVNGAKIQKLLKNCDSLKVISEENQPGCYLKKKNQMVEDSHALIAVYDGREQGSTLYAIRYALYLGKEVWVIKV